VKSFQIISISEKLRFIHFAQRIRA